MRRVNIVSSNSVGISLDGFENLLVNNIDSVYSCSIDMIYCGTSSIFDNQQFYPIIEIMLDKLKPNGQLVLVVNDIKRLCGLYIDSHISEQDFFNIIRSTNNSYNVDNVIQFLENKNFDIVDIKKEEWRNQIVSIKKII